MPVAGPVMLRGDWIVLSTWKAERGIDPKAFSSLVVHRWSLMPLIFAPLSLGSQPDPAPQDQQHLLRGRRSTATPLARPRSRRGNRAGTPGWPDADPGTTRSRLAAPRWGLIPRTENGCLQAGQPPHIDRLELWLKARVQVPARPDWFFVKLHAHGAHESSHEILLGEPMERFHQDLADRVRRDPNFHYHCVTGEMYNLVKAAEEGWKGTVAEALNYHLVWERALPSSRSLGPTVGKA